MTKLTTAFFSLVLGLIVGVLTMYTVIGIEQEPIADPLKDVIQSESVGFVSYLEAHIDTLHMNEDLITIDYFYCETCTSPDIYLKMLVNPNEESILQDFTGRSVYCQHCSLMVNYKVKTELIPKSKLIQLHNKIENGEEREE